MCPKPKSIDDYLERLESPQRTALERLRRQIAAAAPDAHECITYSLPGFKLNRTLLAFGAAAKHCALYPMSTRVVASLKPKLADFECSPGTIRFKPSHPLPASLVRAIVKARVAEVAARPKTRATKAATRRDPAVDTLLRTHEHPLKAQAQALRTLILGLSPSVHEEFKWNSPSFKTTDHFATINLSSKSSLRLILHTGAKTKAPPKSRAKPADPKAILRWLAPLRAMVAIDTPADLVSKRTALRAVLKAWLHWVSPPHNAP